MEKRRLLNGAAFVLALALIVCGALLLFRKVQEWRYPRRYSDEVQFWSGEYDLDPMLLYAFIRTESGFDTAAVSNVGARGLMQITEETFLWIKSKIAPGETLSYDDLYGADTNIRFGAYYVKACLDRYGGDIATAAAAYHSGWGTVDSLLEKPEYAADGAALTVFPYRQMNNYVAKIARCYEKYKELYGSEKEV